MLFRQPSTARFKYQDSGVETDLLTGVVPSPFPCSVWFNLESAFSTHAIQLNKTCVFVERSVSEVRSILSGGELGVRDRALDRLFLWNYKKRASALSSSGLGRGPLKAKTRVQIPIGSLERQDQSVLNGTRQDNCLVFRTSQPLTPYPV